MFLSSPQHLLPSLLSSSTTRWLSVRLEFLGNLLVLAAAMFAVVSENVNQSLVGLSVSYALQVSLGTKWSARNCMIHLGTIMVKLLLDMVIREPDSLKFIYSFSVPSENMFIYTKSVCYSEKNKKNLMKLGSLL